MRFFFYVIFVLLISACGHHYSAELESSLIKAGKNKDELEVVLNHYQNDTLKFKASCYLIVNMDGHFSNHHIRAVPKVVLNSYTLVDSLIHSTLLTKDKSFNIGTTQDSLYESQIEVIANRLMSEISFVQQPKAEFSDLRSIKSEWLINHIDNAFFNWRTSSYAKDLSFEEFLQTLLVYRFRNEALDVTSSFYNTHLKKVLRADSIPDLAGIIERFNRYTFYADCFEDNGKHLGNLGFYDILQFYKYECSRQSEWPARALNANGIPASFDFTASWLNRNRHHFWVAVRDKSGIYRPFTPKWQPLDDTTYFRRTSKVYRRTFDKQVNPFTLKKVSEEIPEIFNSPFFKDVSEQYHSVVNISVPIKDNIIDGRLGYLAIFSGDGWKPVGWGIIDPKKRLINFEKVPVNVVYIAGTYQNKRLVPLGPPFFLDNQGHIKVIRANSQQPTTLHLTRKFYKKEDLTTKMEAMIGARIQGANKPDFTDAKDLHILNRNDFEDMAVKAIPLSTVKRYRYLRCLPRNEMELNLAVFEVYSSFKYESNNNTGTLPYAFNSLDREKIKMLPKLTRVQIKPLGDTTGFNAISDGNMETFLTTRILKVDIRTPTKVKQIRIAPRNANNGINIGDHYELFYYDDTWKSAGIKTAKSNYLDYLNVPRNTIYWLRNRDHGKEEQAFIYENGEQIFVNHDQYIHQK